MEKPAMTTYDADFVGMFNSTQAAAFLGRPVTGDMTLAEVVALRPVSVQRDDVRVGQYL